jgi:hypothetical protein
MSTVLYVDRLPHNTEPSFAYTFFDGKLSERVKEIYTYQHGGSCAWVVFETHEDAQAAALRYDGHHFGPNSQKVYTYLSSEDRIPAGELARLTEYRHQLEHQLESRTVQITGLPHSHTERSLNLLLDPFLDEFQRGSADPGPYVWDEIMHAITLEFPVGTALVQLKTPSMAKSIVYRFAGTYWKNATLNARCVPDQEIDLHAHRRHIGRWRPQRADT